MDRGGGSWRLNKSLLLDKDICTGVTNTLKEYFKINTPADTPLAIRWDTHKAVIRGILIKHASRIKRSTEEKTKQHSQKLHDKTIAHKKNPTPEKYREYKT